MDADEGLYHAEPQTKGKLAHETIDKKTASHRKEELLSLPIYSSKYKLMGKIDVYRQSEKMLIERKYKIKQIYRGQLYQLWAQYFCLIEMGYEVNKLAFYEISTNKLISTPIPGEVEIREFDAFIEKFNAFNPNAFHNTNLNKCKHCIYCAICDKVEDDNVYQ